MKTNITLALAIMALCKTCFAVVPIGTNSFGPSTLHETFNESIDYNNAIDSPDHQKTGSMVIIGKYSNYVFTNTGVTFTTPIPNLYGNYLPEISVINTNQNFSFASYGYPSSIPGGTDARFLLEAGMSANHFAPYMLTFPGAGASKVGGYWIMSGQNPELDHLVITAYGANGGLLATANVPACNVSNWVNNFYGFASTDGTPIKSISIDYSDNLNAGNPGVANLMFEPIPEPSATIVFTGGLLVITCLVPNGFKYHLNYKNSASDGWQSQTNDWKTNSTGGLVSMTNAPNAEHPQRFYRVEMASP